MDWFCGTRMHSTIAGLSSCVPTFAFSYSPKVRGVFDTCGQGSQVVELRSESIQSCISAMMSSYQSRSLIQLHLHHKVPNVVNQAKEQIETILNYVENRSRKGLAA